MAGMTDNLLKILNKLKERRKQFFEKIYYHTQKYLYDWGIEDQNPVEPEHLNKIKNLAKVPALLVLFFYVPAFFVFTNIRAGFNHLKTGFLYALNAKYFWGGKQAKLEHQDWRSKFGFWSGTAFGAIFGGIAGLFALIFVRIPYHNVISYSFHFLSNFKLIDEIDTRSGFEKAIGLPGRAFAESMIFLIHFVNSGILRVLEINRIFADSSEESDFEKMIKSLKVQAGMMSKVLSYIFVTLPALVMVLVHQFMVAMATAISDGYHAKIRKMTLAQQLARSLVYYPIFAVTYVLDGLFVQGAIRAFSIVALAFDWVWEKEEKSFEPDLNKKYLSWILGFPLGLPFAALTVLTLGLTRVLSGIFQGMIHGVLRAYEMTLEKERTTHPIKGDIEYYFAFLGYYLSLPVSLVMMGAGLVMWDNLKGIWNGIVSITSLSAVTDISSLKVSYTTSWSAKTTLLGTASGYVLGLPYAFLIAVGNFFKQTTISFYFAMIDGYRAASKSLETSSDERGAKAKNYGLLGYAFGYPLGYLAYSLPQFFKEFSVQGYQDALKAFTADKPVIGNALAITAIVENKAPVSIWRNRIGYTLVYPFGYAAGLGVSIAINSNHALIYVLRNSSRLALMGRPGSKKLAEAPGRFVTGGLGYILGGVIAIPIIFTSFLARIGLDNYEMMMSSYDAASLMIEKGDMKPNYGLTKYNHFDRVLGGLGIAGGSTSAFAVKLAKYSFQDFSNWFTWFSTRGITEIYSVEMKLPRLMGIPGLIIGSTLGIISLTFITGLRWGIYDPIVGMGKGMQKVFAKPEKTKLYQLQYPFFGLGLFLAHQFKEGFYLTIKIAHLAVNDILPAKIEHQANWMGIPGMIVGTFLGIGLGITTWIARLLSYDLVKGAYLGWQFAYSKFRKVVELSDVKDLSIGTRFWNAVFFFIGLGLMSQFFGFMKFIPWGINIIWKDRLPKQEKLSYFDSEDPELSSWYMPGLISSALAVVLSTGLAAINFGIRMMLEAVKGSIDGIRYNKIEKLPEPFQFMYKIFYSIGQYTRFTFEFLMALPKADIQGLPKAPENEKTNYLGAAMGIPLGVSVGLMFSTFFVFIPRIIKENYITLRDGFIQLATLQSYQDEKRTDVAIYGYSGLSYLLARSIGLVISLFSVLYVGLIYLPIIRPLTMTRNRFSEFEAQDPEIIKIKNLYASVNNWDRNLDEKFVNNISQDAKHSGGKGGYCFLGKSLTVTDDSQSEQFLDSLLAAKKQKGLFTREQVCLLADEKKLTTEQKDAVANYLFGKIA